MVRIHYTLYVVLYITAATASPRAECAVATKWKKQILVANPNSSNPAAGLPLLHSVR